MWQRIIHEQWTTIIPILSFVVTFSVFLFVAIRAIQLPKKRREHLANIPLDDKPIPEATEKEAAGSESVTPVPRSSTDH